jgi:hypothetical protein
MVLLQWLERWKILPGHNLLPAAPQTLLTSLTHRHHQRQPNRQHSRAVLPVWIVQMAVALGLGLQQLCRERRGLR